ncbi:MAG: hypothetical protein AAFW64_04835 [Pseudomonadota bacterium]
MSDDKIEVENINVPGQVTRLDRAKYTAMKTALLASLTDQAPGMTAAEMKAALLPHLDPSLFPGGKTSGWWMKSVQLDLEAKGTLRRTNSKPLRFYRLG